MRWYAAQLLWKRKLEDWEGPGIPGISTLASLSQTFLVLWQKGCDWKRESCGNQAVLFWGNFPFRFLGLQVYPENHGLCALPGEGLSLGHLTKRGFRGSKALHSTRLISWSAPKTWLLARTIWCEWHERIILCKKCLPYKLEKEIGRSHMLSFFVDPRYRPFKVAGRI